MQTTPELTSSTASSSTNTLDQKPEQSLQRARAEHLDPATLQTSAAVGTDVQTTAGSEAALITRADDAASLHPGGDASHKTGKQVEKQPDSTETTGGLSATPPADPEEEIKRGTLSACETLKGGIGVLHKIGDDPVRGHIFRQRVVDTFRKNIEDIKAKGELGVAERTQIRIFEISASLYATTNNLNAETNNGNYGNMERCILDAQSALTDPWNVVQENPHITDFVRNAWLAAVIALYPEVGKTASAWLTQGSQEIDRLAGEKRTSESQIGQALEAGGKKYSKLADEIKSFMKLAHLFVHFSKSIGEFYQLLSHETTQANIQQMEKLTRHNEKLLHINGVPAANALVKDSFAVLESGLKLFSKSPEARGLHGALKRAMGFWQVLGPRIHQKLTAARQQACRVHPELIQLFNHYGGELSIELQQLASQAESQSFSGVDEAEKRSMVDALRHASEGLDILASALDVTLKIDTTVAATSRNSINTLDQELKIAFGRLNYSAPTHDLDELARLFKEVDISSGKTPAAPPKKDKEEVPGRVESSDTQKPIELSPADTARLERAQERYADTLAALEQLHSKDIERTTRMLLKEQTMKNGAPVRLAKAEEFEKDAAQTIARGIQTIERQLARLASDASTIEELSGKKGVKQEAAAVRSEWKVRLERLETHKKNYEQKGWSSTVHRVNLFQLRPVRSELYELIKADQFEKVELVRWQTHGPNLHFRAWNLHAKNGLYQQHHIFVDDNNKVLFSHTKPEGQGGTAGAWHGRTVNDPALLQEDLETFTQLGGWLPDPYQAEEDGPKREVSLMDFVRQ